MVPEIVNVEQAEAWDGPSGAAWVEREDLQNDALRAHTEQLFGIAQIGRADRVLDVGCGCGETTRESARRAVDGDALGVDLSAAMLARGRERAADEGLSNVRFEQADAQVHPFPAETFDVVVSRFGSMFFADPVAAFANIGRAMVGGGRLAAVVWQEFGRNEWLTAPRDALAVGRELADPPPSVPGAFGLADPDHTRSVLGHAGFDEIEIVATELPFRFGGAQEEAVTFVREIGLLRGLLDGLDADDAARALDALRATISAHDTGDGIVFDSRAWLITAVR